MNKETENGLKAVIGKGKWIIELPEEGAIRVSDGPHGLRVEENDTLGFPVSRPAPAYPTASAAACSFDRELIYQTASAMAEDCRQEDVSVLLGPGVNHKRIPLCGRNFEYFSEDPVLSGELGTSFVLGLQDHGIGACVKHFAGNNREYLRTSYDSVIDERTLHELYLRQFETIVRKAKPWSIMPAYNRLNGNYCCENEKLLSEGRKWGFDGAYISDWGAVSDPAASFRSGLNVQMPGGDYGVPERLAVMMEKGLISEEQVTENTEIIRRLIRRTKQVPAEHPYDARQQLHQAEEAAARSIVLAQNSGILPLRRDMTIALIGENARTSYDQGEGSSLVNPLETGSLEQYFMEKHIHFYYADGSDPVYAETVARQSDAAILVIRPEEKDSETFDRMHMGFRDETNALAERILSAQPHTVVCVQCGAPVIMPWADRAEALILTYLSGCMSARALTDILFGDRCPCGKTAETWPLAEKDYPHACESGREFVIPYRETIFSGYRYYNTFHIPVRYCFGHGLSYTSFRYDDIRISKKEDKVEVSFRLTNTGETAGREAVQLYVAMPDSRIVRAEAELKDFASISLEAKEEKTVTFLLDRMAFAYYDARCRDWQTEEGTYEIRIGASSRDIRLRAEVFMSGTADPFSPFAKEDFDGALIRDEAAFARVIGHDIPREPSGTVFTPDSSVRDLKNSFLGRIGLRGISYIFDHTDFVSGIRKDTVLTTPIRQSLMASERMTWDTVDAITDMLNGRMIHGIRKLRRSIRRK